MPAKLSEKQDGAPDSLFMFGRGSVGGGGPVTTKAAGSINGTVLSPLLTVFVRLCHDSVGVCHNKQGSGGLCEGRTRIPSGLGGLPQNLRRLGLPAL